MAVLKLEDFGSPLALATEAADLPEQGMSPDQVEAERLVAFDRGYSAGWEDANKSVLDDAARMKSDFANTLRDMGFTFHEARAHVMRGLVPLLKAVVETVLPKAVHDTLGARLEEEIRELAEEVADTPILLRAAPGEAEQMRDCIADVASLPIDLAEDESVPPGQLFLILGRSELNIDLGGAISRLTRALDALDHDMKEKLDA